MKTIRGQKAEILGPSAAGVGHLRVKIQEIDLRKVIKAKIQQS